MRVLLVGPDLESNLSLRYLASSLRQGGHQARIATFDAPSDAPAVLRAAAGFDLIGLSMCFQVRGPEFLELARALKAAEPLRPVVAGGHFASCAATELLEHHPELDLIVIHEGEQALVELADLGDRMLERAGEVRGVALRQDGRPTTTAVRPILEDLDSLPLPDRSGPARLVAGVPTAYLMGSRGCVSACDYCCITTLHRLAPGRRFRQRGPQKVADEMAGLFHQHGVRQFVFHDDNFLVPSHAHNQERIDALGAALEERGVKDVALVLKCSPRDAEERILTQLKSMGLIRIFMGIESASQCGLDAIGRKQTVAEAERALSLCEKLEISSQYTLITFHPEATAESMLEDLAFARRHPAHPLNYCRAEVYAGTPLEKRLLESGRAHGNYLGRGYRYSDPRVEKVWELGSELFAGRCWGKDEILGQAIRLDHQITVARHFYEGAAVQKFARQFREYQVELNLGTAGLFAELVELCADSSLSQAQAAKALEGLERREKKSRAALHRRLCEFRAAVEQCTHAALPAAVRPATKRRRLRSGLAAPRHAAAVVVALGLAAGPLDAGAKEKKRKPDAGTPVVVPDKPFHEDHGVAEAAPPPYDRYQIDLGVAEAAPPPIQPRRPYWGEVFVSADAHSRVALNGEMNVSGYVPESALLKSALKFTVRGADGEPRFTVTIRRKPSGDQVAIFIDADKKLRVQFDGKELGETPVTTSSRSSARVRLRLREPKTGAWLQVIALLDR